MTQRRAQSRPEDLFGAPAAGGGAILARVLLPVAIGTAYTYRVPDGMSVVPGSIVRVPLGTREVIGAVWGIEDDTGGLAPSRIKDVLAVYDDVPPLAADLRALVEWVASWTLAAPEWCCA